MHITLRVLTIECFVFIDEEAPEDAASRWREGVLEDAGASSSFASVFNLDTKVRQSSSATVAAVRRDWSPAASQVSTSVCCWSCRAAKVQTVKVHATRLCPARSFTAVMILL